MMRLIAAVIAALFLAAPLAANAQMAPTYAAGPADDGDANIHGRILNFDGAYSLQVRDEQGYVDNVQLHQGTIINPTGLTLAPGMVVSIMGYNAGDYFAANEVDTPYTYYSGVPYYAGHPWNYYGPSISLGFFFGNSGWWHGGAFHGGYHYVGGGGARVYNSVHVNNVYRGGAYQGRNYVARPEHGGYVPHGAAHAPQHVGGGGGGDRHR